MINKHICGIVLTMTPQGRQTPEQLDQDPAVRSQQLQDIGNLVTGSIEGIQRLPLEEQREAVESLALDVLGEDPEGKANMLAIDDARSRGLHEEAEPIIRAQRQVLRRIQRDIAFMCGVQLEDTEDQKEEYRRRLHDKLDQLDPSITGEPADDEQIMLYLGFLRIDPKTQNRHFQFPAGIFPPYIREKWEQYVKYVESHVSATREHQLGVGAEGDVVRWDNVRRLTHNNLAEEVRDFLELEGWDTERCRKFITKLLEERHPTLETRETRLTTDAILRRYVELRKISGYDHDEHEHHTTTPHAQAS